VAVIVPFENPHEPSIDPLVDLVAAGSAAAKSATTLATARSSL